MSDLPRRLALIVAAAAAVTAAGPLSSAAGHRASAHTSPARAARAHHAAHRAGVHAAAAHRVAATLAPIALSHGWRYTADPSNSGLWQAWPQGGSAGTDWIPVSMPNDFNPAVIPSGNRGQVGWYAVSFTGPRAPRGHSWRIAFESVRRNAQVWLNGVKVGASSDPYAPFSVPAKTLVPGARNRLVVRVDNLKGPGALPEDWWNWGGIMGPVSLEPVGRVSFGAVTVTPRLRCRLRCASLAVSGMLTDNAPRALRPQLAVTVTAPAGATWTVHAEQPRMPARGSRPFTVTVPIHGRPALWSPASPALYRVGVRAVVAGTTEQATSLRTGLRTVRVRRGLLYLNGRRLWLHGAAIHEDIAGHGAALTDGDIARIVSELKALGANVTRAHYLLSPRLLDALDAAGIMVWSQAPVDHADPVLRSPSGRAQALALLRSTLIGGRNHPSVIVDSVGNELTPTPDTVAGTRAYLLQAVPLVHRLAPGIPVALDTYCYTNYPAQKIYDTLDVLGISSYFGWYSGSRTHSIASFSQLRPFLELTHRRYPKLALAVSEYGAEAIDDGSAGTKGSYEFQSNYIEDTLDVLDGLPYMSGSIYWTLREFAVAPGWTGGAKLPAGAAPDGIHHKGLIAYDGAVKPAFTVTRQLFARQPPFVH
jgi:hypothetical protein